MKKFDLFIGFLGNGATVCNKAVAKSGDYMQVAHISPAGNIKYYVPVETIPGADLLKIEHCAAAMESNFIKWLDAEIATRPAYIYEKMLDALPWEIVKKHFEKGIKGAAANCNALRAEYLRRA